MACLLILDNIETIWEPIESPNTVEELLSHFTGINHLALIITISINAARWTIKYRAASKQTPHCQYSWVQSYFATLLSTSPAYISDKRVKVLVPIWEYMQRFQPPEAHLVHPLLNHFQELLDIYNKFIGTALILGTIAQITSNFADIQNLLLCGLQKNNSDLVKIIHCAVFFHHFSQFIGRAVIPSMDQISNALPEPIDHRLKVCVITEVFRAWTYSPISNPGALVDQALDHFYHFDDPVIKWIFCLMIGTYCLNHNQFPMAMAHTQTALDLASSISDNRGQALSLQQLGAIKWFLGDFPGAKIDAYESQKLAKISGDLLAEAQGLLNEDLEEISWACVVHLAATWTFLS
ncbi:hypothetical protein FB451DRAFT_1183374 [Mycena latifolia]|nr:hypothetical protein FB451DRAFT_1183374 [Mycena latifolia]